MIAAAAGAIEYAMTQGELVTYHGMSKKGLIKLTLDGERQWGTGNLFKLAAWKSAIAEKRKPTPMRQSPQYLPNVKHETRLRCVGHRTGNLYLFIGVLNAPDTKLLTKQNELSPTSHKRSNHRPESKMVNNKRKSYGSSQLEAELEIIGAMRRAGLDPDLKIRHVCAQVRESRATIYRKMKLGQFPMPSKRGNSSFWRWSEIDVYQSGSVRIQEK